MHCTCISLISLTFKYFNFNYPELETMNRIAFMKYGNSDRKYLKIFMYTEVSRYNSASVLHWWSIIGGWGQSQMTNGMKSKNDTLSYLSLGCVYKCDKFIFILASICTFTQKQSSRHVLCPRLWPRLVWFLSIIVPVHWLLIHSDLGFNDYTRNQSNY